MDIVKTTAAELLESGSVTAVIGYTSGTLAAHTHMFTAYSKEDAEKLVFNEYCTQNLALYLNKQHLSEIYSQAGKKARSAEVPAKKPVGIFVKGCDVKSVNVLIQEHQINREDVMLIGVKCSGVKYSEDSPLPGKCLNCTLNIPQTCDTLIESVNTKDHTPAKQPEAGVMERVAQLEKMSLEERWEFWTAEFDKCIKCYACRQVCPLCYCDTCITDKTRPGWIDQSVHPVGNMAWHLIRAFHLAGRCTGCNECERACHQGIPLSLLNAKLAKEIFGLYGYRSGESAEAKPVLTDFRTNDDQNFIM